MPHPIPNKRVESYCLDVLGDIGCGDIQEKDVHACHRLRNKGNIIIRFVNRKHADKALYKRKKVKDIDRVKYELLNGSRGIFINESLCKPMGFMFFKVRQAHKGKKIEAFNLWKGKLSLKLNGNEHFISHIDDLIEFDSAEEDNRLLFLKLYVFHI